jgi:hypothetical protein
MSLDELLRLAKDVLLPIGAFFAGLFLPHVQKPLAEYRKTLADISQLMLRNVPILYGDSPKAEISDEAKKHNAELRKFFDDVRILHARLVSSADSIPKFARPLLEAVGLLHSRANIEQGAMMLVGISNQVLTTDKDKPHLTEIIKRLGTALNITV